MATLPLGEDQQGALIRNAFFGRSTTTLRLKMLVRKKEYLT